MSAAALLFLLLIVAGCASVGTRQVEDVTHAYTAHLGLEKAWWVTFAPRPDPNSAANGLARPRAYQSAILSYFDDPSVTAQLPTEAAADLAQSGAVFSGRADLDRDGAVELYRTGFALSPDGSRTSFLAVWENGRLLHTEFEEAQRSRNVFSALALPQDGREGSWLFCLSCGDFFSFSLQDKRLKFSAKEPGL
ncbi:MAG TPA: hypothetical protein VM308_05035 [Sphingomicrobium sp.]|nr:hypothetical protein [Sphingomicrobium sp.]